MEWSTLNFKFEKFVDVQNILTNNNQFLKIIEEMYDCEITSKGSEVLVKSTDITFLAQLDKLFLKLIEISQNCNLTTRDIIYLVNMEKKNLLNEAAKVYIERMPIVTTYTGKVMYAKTITQVRLLETLRLNDVVFVTGPAGTGKTYVPVLYAIDLYKKQHIKKIIITRPAVEAGESLGFLPGDLKEKINPYLQPLYDALYDCLEIKTVEALMQQNIIEVIPLAYMRGRTLNNAFIILDEAQNTSKVQMKMFLTRLGINSQMVITGDTTQIDLHKNMTSGLIHALNTLKGINKVKLVRFQKEDVVRHPLVQNILKAYEDMDD